MGGSFSALTDTWAGRQGRSASSLGPRQGPAVGPEAAPLWSSSVHSFPVLFRLPFLSLSLALSHSLSGFCLNLSFLQGSISGSLPLSLSFPRLSLGSCQSLSRPLSRRCALLLVLLWGARETGRLGGLGRCGAWVAGELTRPPGGRQAARRAGGGIRPPKLSHVLFLEKQEEGGSGREAAMPRLCLGWKLPGPGPWQGRGRGTALRMGESRLGKKGRAFGRSVGWNPFFLVASMVWLVSY